jgi:NlpC/P60 family putative phage cell wall peptidase
MEDAMTAVRCSDPEDVVAEARRWLGTPYCHQASCRGVGTDCLGLLRGIWREVIGPEPQPVPPYSADWVEGAGDERLLDAALRHLIAVPDGDSVRGDVLLFRMIAHGPVKHVAVLSSDERQNRRMIHAYSGHAVCETSLTAAWRRRLAGVFRFPAAS